jgi:hypothetical protein
MKVKKQKAIANPQGTLLRKEHMTLIQNVIREVSDESFS